MKKVFILLMGLLCFAQTKAQLLDSLVFNYDSISHYENAYDYILDPIDKSGANTHILYDRIFVT